MQGCSLTPSNSSLDEDIHYIKEDLKDEYRAPHAMPWIIGFSGGKDSSLMLHLVIETLLELPCSARRRPIHIIANDTLVESPIVLGYVDRTLNKLSAAMAALGLPCVVEKTVPDSNDTFWVNLIGKGYPAPTRMFRWCTDRMKIRPTTEYIKKQVDNNGQVILLLGVRRFESPQRTRSARRYDNGQRLNRHNNIPGCLVFRPILELTTDDVWEYLADHDAPWGGSHNDLVDLYRNAAGGECPIVLDPDAAPSCGSSSARFGCWTCTVVTKDKSFRNSLEQGYKHLEPMTHFRDWLKEFCYEPGNRMPQRRNGQDGVGPLTPDARAQVLDRLLTLQQECGEPLITPIEIRRIKEIWMEDQRQGTLRQAERLLGIIQWP